VTPADPADGAAALARGQALVTLGRHRDALAVLARAAVLSPGDPAPWCLQAACHLSLGEPQAALTAAERAVAAAPANSWGHRVRALALAALDRPGDAEGAAAEAVRLAPASVVNLQLLAQCQVKAGHKAQGADTAERVRQLAPADPATWLLLNFVALRSGQPGEAARHALQALRLDPTNSLALNNLGVAYRHQFRFIRALQCFIRSWRLAPNAAHARRNIAGALVSLAVLTVVGTVQLATHGPGWLSLVVPIGAALVLWRGLRGLPSPALRVVGRDLVNVRARRASVAAQTVLIVSSPIWAYAAVSTTLDLAHRVTARNVPFGEIAFDVVFVALVVLTVNNVRHGKVGRFKRRRQP
jgi:tetratricopeptide (TPR) repeat protein